jgi:hypothetical protein
VTTDRQLGANQAVVAWLDAHTRAQDQVFAFAASAALYIEARRETSFPYLWYGNVEHVPGAIPLLRSWLGSADRPAFVVVYQQPDEVDPTGGLSHVLATAYRKVGTAGGYDILERVADERPVARAGDPLSPRATDPPADSGYQRARIPPSTPRQVPVT